MIQTKSEFSIIDIKDNEVTLSVPENIKEYPNPAILNDMSYFYDEDVMNHIQNLFSNKGYEFKENMLGLWDLSHIITTKQKTGEIILFRKEEIKESINQLLLQEKINIGDNAKFFLNMEDKKIVIYF